MDRKKPVQREWVRRRQWGRSRRGRWGATLDPVSGRKHIKHQRSDSEGVECWGGGFTQECFFLWSMQSGRSSMLLLQRTGSEGFVFLFFCCETRVLPRDSSGTGRFLDRPGGYAAGPSKQDVLLTVVLSRSGSSGVQLLSVHSVTTHMRVCVFFSLLCNTGQFSPAV